VSRIPRLVVLACAALAAAGACGSSGGGGGGGGGNATPISDPAVIITQSASSLQGVTSFHLKATVNGTVNIGKIMELTGSSSPLGGSISLQGTTLEGDFDMTHQAYHMTLSMPTFLGLTADIIQVDGYQYTKTSLSGDKYTKSEASTPLLSAAPSATPDIADQVQELKRSLDDMGATATLVGKEQVDGKDAYHVKISIPVDKINEAIASAAPSAAGITVESLSIDYWVFSGDLRPAKGVVNVSSAALGNVDATVTLTKYNQSVNIQAPPANMVQE
jgi:hypothetical protein